MNVGGPQDVGVPGGWPQRLGPRLVGPSGMGQVSVRWVPVGWAPGGGYKWEGPKEMGPWGVVLSCGSQGVGLGGLVPG